MSIHKADLPSQQPRHSPQPILATFCIRSLCTRPMLGVYWSSSCSFTPQLEAFDSIRQLWIPNPFWISWTLQWSVHAAQGAQISRLEPSPFRNGMLNIDPPSLSAQPLLPRMQSWPSSSLQSWHKGPGYLYRAACNVPLRSQFPVNAPQ